MTLTIDFKNIVAELENKNVNLCFIKDRGMFIEDNNGTLYSFGIADHSSYLDSLIKNEKMITFNRVCTSKSKNIKDYEKEIWGVSEVSDFIERQSPYW